MKNLVSFVIKLGVTVAIFVGIPLSFWAYKRWILPLFERK